MKRLDDLAKRVFAFEAVDKSAFQRKARVLQSLWRMDNDYPMGTFRGRSLGARLEMPWARQTLANFLTDEVRQVVREEVLDPARSRGKLYGKPRLFNNLLSSQPLAFNLFGVLSRDLTLATDVLRRVSAGRIHEVTRFEFEHSPGRGDGTYTGDRSAFDVYVEYHARDGKPGFASVEVKYHENLANKPGRHRDRYDQVAEAMGCFDPAAAEPLRRKPLQQIWRDHLLAGSLLLNGDFADGLFVMLSPADNAACNNAVAEYRGRLTCERTFAHWALESVVDAVEAATDAGWIKAFRDRYLNFAKVDRQMEYCG